VVTNTPTEITEIIEKLNDAINAGLTVPRSKLGLPLWVERCLRARPLSYRDSPSLQNSDHPCLGKENTIVTSARAPLNSTPNILNSALPNELRRIRTKLKPIPMGELNHLADRSVDLRGDPSVAAYMTVPRLVSVSCFGMQ
jgi:hypothetical protein